MHYKIKSKTEFLVLRELAESGPIKNQKIISENINISPSSTNIAIKKLIKEKKIYFDNHNYSITPNGINFIKPYKVDNAIIIAAGYGSRLRPITLNTPKPLVRVNNKIMIESLIEDIIRANIPKIYIVVGYLKEQFSYLSSKYTSVKIVLIENNYYNISNNISSIYSSVDNLSSSYICEGDLSLQKENLFHSYEYQNFYFAEYISEIIDDWCFYVQNHKIRSVTIGGENTYKMIGISYWNKESSKKLSEMIIKTYENTAGGKEDFWDMVPLSRYKNDFDIYVKEVPKGSIFEIDSFDELKQIDSAYNI